MPLKNLLKLVGFDSLTVWYGYAQDNENIQSLVDEITKRVKQLSAHNFLGINSDFQQNQFQLTLAQKSYLRTIMETAKKTKLSDYVKLLNVK